MCFRRCLWIRSLFLLLQVFPLTLMVLARCEHLLLDLFHVSPVSIRLQNFQVEHTRFLCILHLLELLLHLFHVVLNRFQEALMVLVQVSCVLNSVFRNVCSLKHTKYQLLIQVETFRRESSSAQSSENFYLIFPQLYLRVDQILPSHLLL